ncbi:hypothetical protein AWENTII_010333 [Aspergillus wentii]
MSQSIDLQPKETKLGGDHSMISKSKETASPYELIYLIAAVMFGSRRGTTIVGKLNRTDSHISPLNPAELHNNSSNYDDVMHEHEWFLGQSD